MDCKGVRGVFSAVVWAFTTVIWQKGSQAQTITNKGIPRLVHCRGLGRRKVCFGQIHPEIAGTLNKPKPCVRERATLSVFIFTRKALRTRRLGCLPLEHGWYSLKHQSGIHKLVEVPERSACTKKRRIQPQFEFTYQFLQNRSAALIHYQTRCYIRQ
jgi:hypothetical protein